MAFGISFIDIDLLIRLARNQSAESETFLLETETGMLRDLPVLSEPVAAFSAGSFSAPDSETDIAAALTEIAPVVLPIDLIREKTADENEKAAANVFNSLSLAEASGVRNLPVKPISPTNNFPAQKSNAPNEMNAELIFRALMERFRASVTYDYEIGDALKLEEDAERKQNPCGDENENRSETGRRKLLRDGENFKQEALRKAGIEANNQSAEDKKRELRKKIEEANKFL